MIGQSGLKHRQSKTYIHQVWVGMLWKVQFSEMEQLRIAIGLKKIGHVRIDGERIETHDMGVPKSMDGPPKRDKVANIIDHLFAFQVRNRIIRKELEVNPTTNILWLWSLDEQFIEEQVRTKLCSSTGTT